VAQLTHFVPKPWGREYLAWSNEDCAIWLLELNPNSSTSFHCHLRKNTGLICIQGSLRLSLIGNDIDLNSGDKLNIFRGRFHRTTNCSTQKAVLIEVEAPVDKGDLLRWEDSNGRQGSQYETERREFKGGEERLDLELIASPPKGTNFLGCMFKFLNAAELQAEFSETSDADVDAVYIMVAGGIEDSQIADSTVVVPGDVISNSVLKKLLDRFQPKNNTRVLKLSWSINRGAQ
jgi:mannose-6-phosphate isomerase-like protein (cupin superfamily)